MKQSRKVRFALRLGLSGILLSAFLLSCSGKGAKDDVAGIEPGGRIYGTVFFQGTGLADVALSLNTGPTLTTDSTGMYSLGMVPQGTYTITPSKSGYLFTPSSATVTIANYSDSKEADFTASTGF